MHIYLTVVVGVVTLTRVIWFAEFLVLSLRRQASGTSAWQRLKNDARLPPRLRRSATLQQERLDLFKTHQVSAFTLGGLAFAAWSILFADVARGAGDRFAVGMLAATILTSIGSTLLFRSAGGELTRMGFESALAIAGLTLTVAMLSLGLRTFDTTWFTWVAGLGPAALLLRDLSETIQQMRLTRSEVFGESQPSS